ncbi:MAG: putative glycosyltransferase, exosortase G system-associated [Lachnospiraceae bacterium]|nr:putative glycosyltransferase, exosortase G system-associated [Lachnospiraceae bacterium]
MIEFISKLGESLLFWSAWIIIPILAEVVPFIRNARTLYKKRKINRIIPEPVQYPDISIIIPVYNSSDTLYNCVKSIYDSYYENDKIRIYLVNNMSKDDSFSVYTKCQKEFPDLRMQWLNSRQGKSRALNLALYNSTGKYIINIDSDGLLEPHALKNMVKLFEYDTTIGCMTGAIMTDAAAIENYKSFFSKLLRKLEYMEYAQAFLAGRSYASEHDEMYTLSGAFSAFRKSAVHRSFMYNTTTIAEDTHITFQMRENLNQKIKLCDNAIFITDPIEGLDKLYTQRQRWQRGSLEVAKMFIDRGFKPTSILTNVNVRTLIYDHTFAFPRLIWYIAMFCFVGMGIAINMTIFAMVIMTLVYIIVSYAYFNSIEKFLKEFPDIRSYYLKQWWVVLILPFFQLLVFFFRVMGIVNSINTTSAWKTMGLKEERIAFVNEIKESVYRLSKPIRDFRKAINYEK